jgi:hypothetical protein
MAINKKLSLLVANHFPEHIVESYPEFIEFIEAYYEWMENNKEVTNVLKTLLSNQDVDTASPGSAVLELSSGSGQYQIDEIVFQGISLAEAIARGRVLSQENGKLEVTDIIGSFNTGFGAVNGVTSEASYLITEVDFLSSTINDFIRWFRVEFIPNIPKEVITDPRKFIKHSRQFYKAKGTQKSYKLLFRILFNENVEFYYPWTDMIRADDAKWIEPKTLKVRALVGNPFQLIGRRIRGTSSFSSALVEDVVSFTAGPSTIYELILNRTSISGVFQPTENIQLEDGSVIATVSAIVAGVNIVDAGEGYSVGDVIEFQTFSTGTGAQAKVTSVGPNGEIQKIEMINFGVDYNISTPPFVIFPPTATPAVGTAILGSLATYPGFFLNDDGMPDTTKYLQDGHFYQQFSYVLRVNQSIDQYRDVVKKLVHPSGLVFFGQLLNIILFNASSTFSEFQPCAFVDIERQQFSNPNLHPELGDFEGQQFPLYNLLGVNQDKLSFIEIERVIEKSNSLGPTLGSFDWLKEQHLPYSGFEAFSEIDTGTVENENYWQLWANYQYENIGYLTFEEIDEKPETPINILPEPRIKIEY